MLIVISPLAFAQLPTVNLIVGVGSASESGPVEGSFILSRSDDGIISEPLPVRVDVQGTAKPGADYPIPDLYGRIGTHYWVDIPADSLSKTITILPVVDAIVEGDETVGISLVARVEEYISGTDATAQLTIVDSAPLVNLVVDDSDASETGPNPGSFILSRSDDGIISEPLPVRVDVQGTAEPGADYPTPDLYGRYGTHYWVDIPADSLSKTITVLPVVDAIVEGDETVDISLVARVEEYISGTDATAQLTIVDSAPLVNLVVDDTDVSETGPNPGSFILSRSDDGIISEPLVVRVNIQGVASPGTDYPIPDLYGRSGTHYWVDIPADSLSKTITILPVVDAIVEGDETVDVAVVAKTSDYIIGTNARAQLTIVDSAPLVNLVVDDADASETGPNPGSFTLSRSDDGIINQPLAVRVDVQGTAKAGTDYPIPDLYGRSGTHYWVDIPADSLSKTITILPVVDAIVEGDETVDISLVARVEEYISGTDATAQLTIVDSAPVVDLVVGDSDTSETGPNPGSFILSRSDDGVISEPLAVRVDVQGTARAGADYPIPDLYGRSGTHYWVDIPADSLSKSITILPVVDGIVEDDETVVFSLVESDSAYKLGDPASANLIIKDYVGGIFKDSFEDFGLQPNN